MCGPTAATRARRRGNDGFDAAAALAEDGALLARWKALSRRWKALSRRWKALPRTWKAVSIAAGVIVASALVLYLSLPAVHSLATQNPTTTAMIELRKQQAARRGKPFRLRWQWEPLSRISPYLQHAVVFAEDDKFWKHDGVDWEAMKIAAEHDWHERTVERGASTIAQQVAKNLFLSPSRNPIRKLREIFIARRLYRELGRRRVLELYLNIAEWGHGIFGAEAASRRWFGCSAAALRPVQAARLAAALPNPFKRNPKVRSRALTRKAARLVRGMRRAGLIDDASYEAAERELGVAPPSTPAPTPEAAPEAAPAAAHPAAEEAAGADDEADTADDEPTDVDDDPAADDVDDDDPTN
jgi:monofunctional biosynthetic peptidoglycan transglycosylase